MAQVRRAGEIIQANTAMTGGGLALLIVVMRLAGMHDLLKSPRDWKGTDVANFLSEGEVQMILSTGLIVIANAWRASRLSAVVGTVDDVIAARLEARLKALTPDRESDDPVVLNGGLR